MRQRILQGTAATLSVVLADQDGNAADAVSTLTVGVTTADGTVVLAAGTATTHGTTGVYSVALTAAQTATLNLLTATWTDAGNARTVTSTHEIVGGYYFSVADIRTSNSGLLSDASKYATAALLTLRQEVEEEAERICDVAFVRRYNRATLDGLGTDIIVLPHNKIRTVRSVRVYPIPGGTQFVTLTASQLAGLVLDDDGTVHRTDYLVFDEGRGNIVVEYEHGYDTPPADLARAAVTRLRSRANWSLTAVTERATSFTADNGQTYNLAIPGAYETGMPEVDAAYQRYSFRDNTDTNVKAAGRAMRMLPQRYSIYHAGR